MLGIFMCRHSASNGGVHQPRPIQVRCETVVTCPTRDALNIFKGNNGATTAIARILEAYEPGSNKVLVRRPNQSIEILLIQHAVSARYRPAHDMAKHGRSTSFVVVDVAVGF